MLEQGKWKDGAPVPSKEFHDRFEDVYKRQARSCMRESVSCPWRQAGT